MELFQKEEFLKKPSIRVLERLPRQFLLFYYSSPIDQWISFNRAISSLGLQFSSLGLQISKARYFVKVEEKVLPCLIQIALGNTLWYAINYTKRGFALLLNFNSLSSKRLYVRI